MRGIGYFLIGSALVLGSALWLLSRPERIDPALFSGLVGDPARGEMVYHAAGCGSCHMAPGAQGTDRLVLSGGQRFETAFGTFVAPNISSDLTHGLGNWSVPMLADAVMAGVAPDGAHYYPAFPWNSYVGMNPQDLVDLHAFLATLPASAVPSQPHDLPLPVRLRRGIGFWKTAFAADGTPVLDLPDLSAEEQRGRYLAEVLGHCGECHTPRNPFGASDTGRWLAGAPDPSGKGKVPNITPAALDWDIAEIAEYLSSGFTPDYDSAGGHMALVVSNFARLPESDRLAVAAYLKRVAPQP